MNSRLQVTVIAEPHWAQFSFAEMLLEFGFQVRQIHSGHGEQTGSAQKLKKIYGERFKNIRVANSSDLTDALTPDTGLVMVLGDISHQVFRFAVEAADRLSHSPTIVGIHNHLLSEGRNPLALLRRAHGFIFISRQSALFYHEVLPEIEKRPFTLIPSLYLPRQQHYEKARRVNKSTFDKRPSRNWLSNRRPSKLSFALGGTFVTGAAESFQRATHRYDFIKLAESLAKSGSAVDIYGKFKKTVPNPKSWLDANLSPPKPEESAEVKNLYQRLSTKWPNVRLVGRVADFSSALRNYDFFLLKGFDSPVNLSVSFESHNYQLRYGSSLIAGTPVISISGTDPLLADQLAIHGFGKICENVSDLESPESLHAIRDDVYAWGNLELARTFNSLESWRSPILELMGQVVSSSLQDSGGLSGPEGLTK